MYHPQLGPLVEGRLRLPSERAARTFDGAMGGLDISACGARCRAISGRPTCSDTRRRRSLTVAVYPPATLNTDARATSASVGRASRWRVEALLNSCVACG
jgi:hypothetical protein